MSQEAVPIEQKGIPGDFDVTGEVDVASIEESARKARRQSWLRLLRYTATKLFVLFFTVVAGVYITVMIANMGGYVDEIRRGAIREAVVLEASVDEQFRQLPDERRTAIIEERVALEEQRLGLDRPFLIRSFTYLADAITGPWEKGAL